MEIQKQHSVSAHLRWLKNRRRIRTREKRRDVFARFNDRAPLRVPRKMHHPRVAHPPTPGEPETFFRRAFHRQRYHIVRLFHRVYTHAPCITPDEWDTGCRGRLHFNQFRLQRRHIRQLKSRQATRKIIPLHPPHGFSLDFWDDIFDQMFEIDTFLE